MPDLMKDYEVAITLNALLSLMEKTPKSVKATRMVNAWIDEWGDFIGMKRPRLSKTSKVTLVNTGVRGRRPARAGKTNGLSGTAQAAAPYFLDCFDLIPTAETARRDLANSDGPGKGWGPWIRAVQQRLCQLVDTGLTPDDLPVWKRNADLLMRAIQGDRQDQAVVEIAVAYRMVPAFEAIWDAAQELKTRSSLLSPDPVTFAAITSIPRADWDRYFSRPGRMFDMGCLELWEDEEFAYRNRPKQIIPPTWLLDIMSDEALESESQLRRRILGDAEGATLQWGDFAHLGSQRDEVAALIANSVQSGVRGISVLIHGEVGTGKTEFVRTLAKQLGLTLYSVAEQNEGKEPTREDRLSRLRAMLHWAPAGSVLMIDEAEDLFGYGANGFLSFLSVEAVGSKVYMNRLIEQAALPIIWIVNDPAVLGRAVLRRMSAPVIEVRSPPTATRARMWATALQQNQIDLPQQQIDALARRFNVPVAWLSNVMRSAAISGAGLPSIERNLEAITRLIAPELVNQDAVSHHGLIDPRITKIKPGDHGFTLTELADKMVQSDRRDFSLCLYGPPGTGKSAYARHIAERMGMEVRQKRASDLISKWVGESEQQIAHAFQQAQRDGVFLIFDEADSLLRNRGQARASWEVSQVNEMLTWMERHPLPFVCTTNLIGEMDSASLRRFTFKMEFDYLCADSARLAFQLFFGLEAPSSLDALRQLTPGDFTTVKRKADILGIANNPAQLVEFLQQEQAAKPNATKPIGFAFGT